MRAGIKPPLIEGAVTAKAEPNFAFPALTKHISVDSGTVRQLPSMKMPNEASEPTPCRANFGFCEPIHGVVAISFSSITLVYWFKTRGSQQNFQTFFSKEKCWISLKKSRLSMMGCKLKSCACMGLSANHAALEG